VAGPPAGGVLEELADRDAVGIEDLEGALPAVGVGGDLEPPPAKAGDPDGVLDLDDGARQSRAPSYS
jgi:hypothetical protein